jgi:hypothetical protein
MKATRAVYWFLFGFTLAALLLPVFHGCAHRPFEDWTKADTAREVVRATLEVIDWGQTLAIVDNPQYHETNFLLGNHPSRSRVNSYFLAGTVLHPFVAGMLRKPYRTWFQHLSIGLSGYCVINNHAIGLRMAW